MSTNSFDIDYITFVHSCDTKSTFFLLNFGEINVKSRIPWNNHYWEKRSSKQRDIKNSTVNRMSASISDKISKEM